MYPVTRMVGKCALAWNAVNNMNIVNIIYRVCKNVKEAESLPDRQYS